MREPLRNCFRVFDLLLEIHVASDLGRMKRFATQLRLVAAPSPDSLDTGETAFLKSNYGNWGNKMERLKTITMFLAVMSAVNAFAECPPDIALEMDDEPRCLEVLGYGTLCSENYICYTDSGQIGTLQIYSQYEVYPDGTQVKIPGPPTEVCNPIR